MSRLAIGMAIGVALGIANDAYAVASHLSDSFVRLLEMKLSGSSHLQITPGVTVTLIECGCTVRYTGVKITGHHYDIGIDKLD